MGIENRVLSDVNARLIEEFTRDHGSVCGCPVRPRKTAAELQAALRHLLKHALSPDAARPRPTPVALELDKFCAYLQNVCGLAPATCTRRRREVGAFLAFCYGTTAPVIARLSGEQIDAFMAASSRRLRPATLGVIRSDLHSYFRFRALHGDATEALAAALPRVANRRYQRLPTVLSETQCERFLHPFNRTHPVELRDYAIARCLLDLGLRGDEVTHLSLASMDWYSATLTIKATKKEQAGVPHAVAGGHR